MNTIKGDGLDMYFSSNGILIHKHESAGPNKWAGIIVGGHTMIYFTAEHVNGGVQSKVDRVDIAVKDGLFSKWVKHEEYSRTARIMIEESAKEMHEMGLLAVSETMF